MSYKIDHCHFSTTNDQLSLHYTITYANHFIELVTRPCSQVSPLAKSIGSAEARSMAIFCEEFDRKQLNCRASKKQISEKKIVRIDCSELGWKEDQKIIQEMDKGSCSTAQKQLIYEFFYAKSDLRMLDLMQRVKEIENRLKEINAG